MLKYVDDNIMREFYLEIGVPKEIVEKMFPIKNDEINEDNMDDYNIRVYNTILYPPNSNPPDDRIDN